MPQFYLGAISPDAIHSRPGAGRPAKNFTHLMPPGAWWWDTNPDEYFKFMDGFITANKANANEDFLLGYGIHILTDMHWTQTIYSKFMNDYQNSDRPMSEMQKSYYHDTDIHEYALYRKHISNSDIWQYLQNPACADFLDLLTAEEIKLWNERTRGWFDAPENQHKFEGNPRYIGALDIEEFIPACAELIVGKLNSSRY